MFIENTKAFKAKEMIQAQSAQIAATVAEACRTVPELHTPKEASVEAKIRKLVVGVCDAKVEVARVQFDLNMKIIKLELKSQTSTPQKVRDQYNIIVKDGVAMVDVIVVDWTMLFEQTMEVVTTLQEDLNL